MDVQINKVKCDEKSEMVIFTDLSYCFYEKISELEKETNKDLMKIASDLNDYHKMFGEHLFCIDRGFPLKKNWVWTFCDKENRACLYVFWTKEHGMNIECRRKSDKEITKKLIEWVIKKHFFKIIKKSVDKHRKMCYIISIVV